MDSEQSYPILKYRGISYAKYMPWSGVEHGYYAITNSSLEQHVSQACQWVGTMRTFSWNTWFQFIWSGIYYNKSGYQNSKLKKNQIASLTFGLPQTKENLFVPLLNTSTYGKKLEGMKGPTPSNSDKRPKVWSIEGPILCQMLQSN